MTDDVLLRFPRVPGSDSELLKQWTGYEFHEEPDSFVVKYNDPIIIAGPKKILKTEKDAWALSPKTYEKICGEFIDRYLVDEFERRLEMPKEKIEIVEAGVISELETAKLKMFFTPRDGLTDVLKSDVIPFMERIGATRVFPLNMDIILQQRALSLMKIAFLNGKYGFEAARVRVLEGRALDSLLPAPTDIMAYVDILNVYAPRAITLPLVRMGSGLYFLADARPRGVRKPNFT